MTASRWPVVTCTACGATGPGRPKAGLCKRCYARAQHPVQACGGCGQTRRHLAAGLCARCYRLSLTRVVTCQACGEVRPVYFGDQCERCKRRAAAQAGACAECGKQVARLWAGRCRADTQQVDIRQKTFADEAIKQLGFLKTQYGFAGPDVEREASPGTAVRVRYRRGGITIEASLVLWYTGEEYVATEQVADVPNGAARRTEIGRNTAHTGYQMRRALTLQAEAARATMRQS